MVIQEKKAAAAKRNGKAGNGIAPGLKGGEAAMEGTGDGIFETNEHDVACAIRIGA
jgi:hypothetical protein